jgi:hypothetical protein
VAKRLEEFSEIFYGEVSMMSLSSV